MLVFFSYKHTGRTSALPVCFRRIGSIDQIDKSGGEYRNKSEDQETAEEQEIERDGLLDEILGFTLCHATGHKHQSTHRRRKSPDCIGEDENHSKMDRIDAIGCGGGGEQGDQNDHAGIALHKHSNKNKENVHGNQKDPFVVNDRDEPLSELLGNTLLGQYPREGGGCGHDQHDGRSCGQSLLQTLSEFLASQLSIPKAQQGGIDDCHRAGLCGGEDAHTDAADDNDGQTEGKNGRTEGFPKHGPCHFALSQRRVIPLVRDAGDHEHHGGAQQDTRPKSGDEQLADGYICDTAVQDQADPRRDQGGDHAGGCGDHGRERFANAMALHLRNEHFGLHGGVGQRGTGQAAHQSGQQDVDLRETAEHTAGDHRAEIHDPLGDAGVVHQNAGADKEGDREKRDAFGAGDGLLGEYGRVDIRIQNKINRRRAQDRGKDRDLKE